MWINRWQCFLIGIVRSIRCLAPVSGHDYIEEYNNGEVSILRCDRCGNVSVGYFTERKR